MKYLNISLKFKPWNQKLENFSIYNNKIIKKYNNIYKIFKI